jgi:hypothetical protein
MTDFRMGDVCLRMGCAIPEPDWRIGLETLSGRFREPRDKTAAAFSRRSPPQGDA